MNKVITYPVAVGTTAVYVGLTAAGCASVGRVRGLEKELAQEKNARIELTDRLTKAETRPLLEGPIEILKEKAPFEYGSVLGVLLPKFKDRATRDKADQYSDIITVSSTLVRGFYKVHVGRDHNKDGKLTPGSGDRTYAVDGKNEWGFILNEAELLQVLKDYMPNARQYQPATAPPVERQPQKTKPFLRRPINSRRQVRLPVRRVSANTL